MSETPAPYLVGPPPTVVLQCPVAGFPYYGGESCWARMGRGDLLRLKREPGNRHDARAIMVEWQGQMLGYVPREANYALSQMLDRGVRVEARVASLLPGSDDWKRVMMVVTVGSPAAGVAVVDAPKPIAPQFDAPELLVRSLVNRVFGASPPAEAFEWVRRRAASIALTGVEHPAMLPFLRLVQQQPKSLVNAGNPFAALERLLLHAGIEPAAWKRLRRWGFAAFEGLGAGWLAPIPIARYANLLLSLDVQSPPPAFATHALLIARYRGPQHDAPLDFERHPTWFMRAVLRGVESAPTGALQLAMRHDILCCVDWLIEAKPSPDANQQHAGWVWVLAQALAHRRAVMLAREAPWHVPVGETTFGPWWVVPIRSSAELVAEAIAMKNCLEQYEDDCRCGRVVVFSIRDALTSEREACFAVERESPAHSWEIQQVAGKMNAMVDDDLYIVAERVVRLL